MDAEAKGINLNLDLSKDLPGIHENRCIIPARFRPPRSWDDYKDNPMLSAITTLTRSDDGWVCPHCGYKEILKGSEIGSQGYFQHGHWMRLKNGAVIFRAVELQFGEIMFGSM